MISMPYIERKAILEIGDDIFRFGKTLDTKHVMGLLAVHRRASTGPFYIRSEIDRAILDNVLSGYRTGRHQMPVSQYAQLFLGSPIPIRKEGVEQTGTSEPVPVEHYNDSQRLKIYTDLKKVLKDEMNNEHFIIKDLFPTLDLQSIEGLEYLLGFYYLNALMSE